jgi:hypothetical protein
MRRLFLALLAPTVASSAFVQAVSATNPITAENAASGTAAWYAVEATPPAIEGYTSSVSVAPGDRLAFHVATSPPAGYRIEIYRLGWYGAKGGRLVGCLPQCATGDFQGEQRPVPGPSGPYDEVRAGWPESAAVVVPATWTTGYYVATLRLTTGSSAGMVDPVPFVVREGPVRRAQILVQVPVNTWQAYNGWGAKSLYPFNSLGGNRAAAVSFDRPYFVGAGRQELTDWEIALVRWLERSGYDVAYQTDVDTHRHPGGLLEHRLVMTSGHDEYWTKEMRDAFEAARARSTNLAFMGANAAYWQVRYENGERTIVSYKSMYDPEPNVVLRTALFREIGRPECALLGVQHQGGMQDWGRHDYYVTAAGAADQWAAGTGWTEGSRIANVVSVERDTVPTFDQACARPVTVLFHYDAGGDTRGNAKCVRYTAASGARVFSSGSMELAWGLDSWPASFEGRARVDPRLQHFMANAMSDLTRPAPGASLSVIVTKGRKPSVTVSVTDRNDPRVHWDFFRRRGLEAAAIADPAWRPVCSGAGTACTDRRVPPGVYRYAVVAVDAWARSEPVLTAPLKVPKARRPPRVR